VQIKTPVKEIITDEEVEDDEVDHLEVDKQKMIVQIEIFHEMNMMEHVMPQEVTLDDEEVMMRK
jgi:hypothetical protein